MFVYALMYNPAGEVKGEFKSRRAGEISQARDMVQTSPRRFPEPGQTWQEIVKIGSIPHINFVTAVTGGNDDVLGYAHIVFKVFPETVAALRKATLKTVFYVLLIILTTTLFLYPVILTLTRQLARYSETLLDSNLETLSVLGSAIAKRDSDTDAHNYRVTIYSVRMAEAMGLDKADIQNLIKGAFLHDVGKIGIRDEILLKPGRLDAKEFKIMKTHVTHGGDIVHRSKWLQDAEDVVAAHHEKFGGGGYPNGLKSHGIPLDGRIFALADVFDALTSKRPYKESFSFEESMQILEQGRGNHFDPKLLDIFSPIAEGLFREFGGGENEKLKETLREIVHQYFSAGLETLTY
jgi:putative nucleotidyltransferase with HDIG domain